MKEVPILFSTPMVKAILDGRKTQTRREIKTPGGAYGFFVAKNKAGKVSGVYAHDENERTEKKDGSEWIIKPKARPGDLLWVRETWSNSQQMNGFRYKASSSEHELTSWKPSIHMPKIASRIWLRVTDVVVERLKDISEEDAFDEGSEERYHRCSGMGYYESGGDTHECKCMEWDREPVVMGYADLCESINGDGSWALNPWVWVYTFEVLSTTGKP